MYLTPFVLEARQEWRYFLLTIISRGDIIVNSKRKNKGGERPLDGREKGGKINEDNVCGNVARRSIG